MKLKRKLGLVLVCLTFSMGCSGILTQLIPPLANAVIGFYDANDYYSKECLWYDEVKLNDETKKWLLESDPPEIVGKDLSQVAKNNDLYKEVCKEHKSVADKMKAKAERIIDKP